MYRFHSLPPSPLPFRLPPHLGSHDLVHALPADAVQQSDLRQRQASTRSEHPDLAVADGGIHSGGLYNNMPIECKGFGLVAQLMV